MGREEAVKRAVGKADAFELLSCAFAYPDERMSVIIDVFGREILDSRGNPTVEVEVSTSNGVMTDRDARKKGVGGEVIAYIW